MFLLRAVNLRPPVITCTQSVHYSNPNGVQFWPRRPEQHRPPPLARTRPSTSALCIGPQPVRSPIDPGGALQDGQQCQGPDPAHGLSTTALMHCFQSSFHKWVTRSCSSTEHKCEQGQTNVYLAVLEIQIKCTSIAFKNVWNHLIFTWTQTTFY